VRDPALHAYLDERQRARAEFAARFPLDLQRLAAGTTPPPPRARVLRLRWAAPLLVAAVACLVVWSRHHPVDLASSAPVADTVRVKGGSLQAELYVNRGVEVWKHRSEIPLEPGDRLRVRVVYPVAGYLTLLGRDARGRVSVYYDSLATSPGQFTVHDSLVLDDDQGGEEWLLLLSDAPHPADDYMRMWRDDAPALRLTPHALFVLNKDAP
jgi:hypothetical protein